MDEQNVAAASTTENQAGVATEAKPEATVIGKKKQKFETGNFIQDTAHEIETMSKTKALNEADRLAENIEINYFKMGGVLQVILQNSWFEGFADFDAFVQERYGFQGRKAKYLISIYANLVDKQIPWDKVAHLGWTKLKDLAQVLTPENVDEWVGKAEKCTVIELQALLKAALPEGKESTAKTTDDVVKITFKLKPDQAETVQQALAKAKGELHTEYDTVALENIAAGYLGGNTTVSAAWNLDEVIKSTGFQALMERVSEIYTEYDISVTEAGAEEAKAE
jgi:hypothetical protein